MDVFSIDVFGKFNQTEIQAIVDKQGRHWFTEQVISTALEIDRTSVARLRENHGAEFSEGDDYTSLIWEGKRRTVYSEEGFLTICDMSRSDQAFRLRKWMRQQFRVRRDGDDIVVTAKGARREDFSTLGPDLVILQQMLDSLAEDRRRIIGLEKAKAAIEEETSELRARSEEHASRIEALEDGASLKPGEMTALQLAQQVRWVSEAGGAHNTAVIVAAANAGFLGRGLMDRRAEQGPNGIKVAVYVFTAQGVAEFLSKIDSCFKSGQAFTLAANDVAATYGMKGQRHVRKR